MILGTAEGISEKGDLLVRDATETLHSVSAGDVSIRPATSN
jgi:biotin-(acetyl-CoA carboxylase) ligase